MNPLASLSAATRGLTNAAHPAYSGAHVAQYQLAIPTDGRGRLAIGWLFLGLGALIASGVFSILLVLSRTPGVQQLIPVADFFHVALVVHVDLSVLVWFVAFAGVFWTLAGAHRGLNLGWGALAVCSAGTLLICAAPFLHSGAPIMANYIPVLDGPVFLAGLVVFAAGVAGVVLRSLFLGQSVAGELDGSAALRLGLTASAGAAAVALFAFVWSWLALPMSLGGKAYYELLFWGGGHVLQFTWTLLMLVAWLWLAEAIGAKVPLSARVTLLLFGLALAMVMLTPFVYMAYDVTSVEHRRLLTWMMRVGGGLSILPLALAVMLALWKRGRVQGAARPLRAALVMSLLLFAAGGLIGFTISGSNVKIPAHYHGCIVAITLAFMGLAYHLLPRLGFRAPSERLATWQPYVYGLGQILHITGLVWSGGYGVQRKVAGADQVLGSLQEVAGMALMGLGGLIAILGGILFLVVVARAVWPHRKSAAEHAPT